MEDLESNLSIFNEILNAVDYMGEEFFDQVDLSLLQRELTVLFYSNFTKKNIIFLKNKQIYLIFFIENLRKCVFPSFNNGISQ